MKISEISFYIAMDFESATGEANTVCQIGLFCDLMTKVYEIRPPGNYYSKHVLEIIGKDFKYSTMYSKPFYKVAGDFRVNCNYLFKNAYILTYGDGLDIQCLKMLEEHVPSFKGVKIVDVQPIVATYLNAMQPVSLKDACELFGLETTGCHDAHVDALILHALFEKLVELAPDIEAGEPTPIKESNMLKMSNGYKYLSLSDIRALVKSKQVLWVDEKSINLLSKSDSEKVYMLDMFKLRFEEQLACLVDEDIDITFESRANLIDYLESTGDLEKILITAISKYGYIGVSEGEANFMKREHAMPGRVIKEFPEKSADTLAKEYKFVVLEELNTGKRRRR